MVWVCGSDSFPAFPSPPARGTPPARRPSPPARAGRIWAEVGSRQLRGASESWPSTRFPRLPAISWASLQGPATPLGPRAPGAGIPAGQLLGPIFLSPRSGPETAPSRRPAQGRRAGGSCFHPQPAFVDGAEGTAASLVSSHKHASAWRVPQIDPGRLRFPQSRDGGTGSRKTETSLVAAQTKQGTHWDGGHLAAEGPPSTGVLSAILVAGGRPGSLGALSPQEARNPERAPSSPATCHLPSLSPPLQRPPGPARRSSSPPPHHLPLP